MVWLSSFFIQRDQRGDNHAVGCIAQRYFSPKSCWLITAFLCLLGPAHLLSCLSVIVWVHKTRDNGIRVFRQQPFLNSDTPASLAGRKLSRVGVGSVRVCSWVCRAGLGGNSFLFVPISLTSYKKQVKAIYANPFSIV